MTTGRINQVAMGRCRGGIRKRLAVQVIFYPPLPIVSEYLFLRSTETCVGVAENKKGNPLLLSIVPQMEGKWIKEMIHNPPSAKSSLVCSSPRNAAASGRAPRRLRLLLRITSSSLFRRKGKTLGAENAWKITRFPAVRANIMPPESVGASSEGGGMVGIDKE